MYNDHKEMIKTTMETVFNVVSDKPRDSFYDYEMGELEYLSRDGFMSFIDGGYRVKKFFFLSTFPSTGYTFGVKEADDMIAKFVEQSYAYAKDEFIKKYPEYKGIDVNYHSLYDDGKGKLAEELSNMEMDNMSNDTIMVDFTVQYYDKGNTHSDKPNKDSVYISAVINWETPYHRGGRHNEKVLFTKTVYAKNAKGTIERLAKKADSIFSRIKD